jgi:DNA polymerase III epsilon subunit-like protein
MFHQDILLLDLEMTGLDPVKNDIIEIAGLRLDKNSLKEIARFESFVKPAHPENIDPEAMAVSQIKLAELHDKPDLATVMRQLLDTCGTDVVLAGWGVNTDTAFLKATFKNLGQPFPFDYHTLDIWVLAYTYAAKHGLLTNTKRRDGFAMEDIANHFGIAVPASRHTALADCLLEAELLRHLVNA